MGAWGTGVFENDGAGDFLAELDQAGPARRAEADLAACGCNMAS
jgi:Domain of unknown function (DUF4259)